MTYLLTSWLETCVSPPGFLGGLGQGKILQPGPAKVDCLAGLPRQTGKPDRHGLPPRFEEWRGRDLSSCFGSEKTTNFHFGTFQKDRNRTLSRGPIGPRARARGPGPPPPQLKIPQFGSQRPRDPKHRIPRVRFMKIRPGGRSGDLNRADFEP